MVEMIVKKFYDQCSELTDEQFTPETIGKLINEITKTLQTNYNNVVWTLRYYCTGIRCSSTTDSHFLHRFKHWKWDQSNTIRTWQKSSTQSIIKRLIIQLFNPQSIAIR
jgi:hypothetical protein